MLAGPLLSLPVFRKGYPIPRAPLIFEFISQFEGMPLPETLLLSLLPRIAESRSSLLIVCS